MAARTTISTLVMTLSLVFLASPAHAQMFFEADWVQLSRDNDASGSIFNGADGLSASSLDYGYDPGFRITLGGIIGDYQIDASFLQIEDWSASRTGTLSNTLVFDDTANNPLVVASPPGTTFGFMNGLYKAATEVMAADESTESEQLRSGATYSYTGTTDFKQVEINLGTARDRHRWRAALGWNYMRFDEANSLFVVGDFDALDVDDGAGPRNPVLNDPNDILSHAALARAGYSLVSGSPDGFDAYDSMSGAPDTLSILMDSRAENELNGIQGTLGFRLVDKEWLVLEATGKAGLYHNSVTGLVSETVVGSVNDNSAYQLLYTDKTSKAAFAGGIGFRGILPLTDYIRLVGGYEVLFLKGVALGNEQVNGVTTDIYDNLVYTIDAGATAIIHGTNAGLEVTW